MKIKMEKNAMGPNGAFLEGQSYEVSEEVGEAFEECGAAVVLPDDPEAQDFSEDGEGQEETEESGEETETATSTEASESETASVKRNRKPRKKGSA